MTVEALLALSVFAFATSITPGPNNMMLLASGVNFGFRRTIPHMLGIGFGFTAMLVVVGLGLGAALTASPSLLPCSSWSGRNICSGWPGAWRVREAFGSGKARRSLCVSSRPPDSKRDQPQGLGHGADRDDRLHAAGRVPATVAVVALVFGSINLPSVSVWAALGTGLRGFLAIPARMRVFNIVMAGLLALSIIPFVL